MYIILNFNLLLQVCILHQIKINKMQFNKYFFVGISVLVIMFSVNDSRSQDTAKIMSYNLLNYSGNNTTKDPYFRQTMDYEKPDVLAVCEILSQAAVNNFLTNVLNFNNPMLFSIFIQISFRTVYSIVYPYIFILFLYCLNLSLVRLFLI